MQVGLFSYADVSFIFYKYQGIDGNDKSLLIDKPVAFRPNNKYVGLELT